MRRRMDTLRLKLYQLRLFLRDLPLILRATLGDLSARCDRCNTWLPKWPWGLHPVEEPGPRLVRRHVYPVYVCDLCTVEIQEEKEATRIRLADWLAQAPTYDHSYLIRDKQRQSNIREDKHPAPYENDDAWLQVMEFGQALEALTEISGREFRDARWPVRFEKGHGTICFSTQINGGRDLPQEHFDTLRRLWQSRSVPLWKQDDVYRYADFGSIYSQGGKIYVVWAPCGGSYSSPFD